MTKQQAFELAEKESMHTGCSYYETAARSMGIYAAAFAEWIETNYWSVEVNTVMKWFNILKKDESAGYTTAELITEFEKQ